MRTFVSLALGLGALVAQEPGKPAAPAPRLASTVTWQRHFGTPADAPDTGFSLLCRGFLRAPTGADLDAKVAAWLAAHPQAVVREVQVLMDEPKRGKLVYVWVVDGDENLALHLVREGCIPAGTLATVDTRPLLVPAAELAALQTAADAAEAPVRAAGKGLWGAVARETAQKRGDALREKGEFAAALVEYEKVVAGGSASNFVWCSVAECRERTGDYQGALAAWDQAIGDGTWWPPYTDKAKCIARHEGNEKAIVWLRSVAKGADDQAKFHSILGDFFHERGETGPAIVEYTACVEQLCQRHQFRFGPDHWLVLDEATLQQDNNDFASLCLPLRDLAALHFQSGDLEAALRYATMAVAIGQQCNRCKGYYKPPEVEAGDVEGRLVRARVFLAREQWDLAAAEVAHAKVLADRGNYSGHQRAVAAVAGELARRRGGG
jgi:tetratricopeptide (TPR) repeat protein